MDHHGSPVHRRICLYLHAHQPFRVRPLAITDLARGLDYFDGHSNSGNDWDNKQVLNKVAAKSYLPALKLLQAMVDQDPDFNVSLSITGTLVEQLERYRPDVLKAFQRLASDPSRVEIVAETYYHSLAFLFDKDEHQRQVDQHREMVKSYFGQTPLVYRGTELMFSNDLAGWAEQAGYRGILAEGVDDILNGATPNRLYHANGSNLPILLKNYKLSDDIAFRFGNRAWKDWPLTTDKFMHWIDAMAPEEELVNLFMDFETFGEHQWSDTGVFDFLAQLPAAMREYGNKRFITVSQATARFRPQAEFSSPEVRTWADEARDLTAWLGNSMQSQAINYLYSVGARVLQTGDEALIDDWRKLQTSDHYYYMCTKWFNDGDVHAYFSPYQSPYDAYIFFMNALRDFELRLIRIEAGR